MRRVYRASGVCFQGGWGGGVFEGLLGEALEAIRDDWLTHPKPEEHCKFRPGLGFEPSTLKPIQP